MGIVVTAGHEQLTTRDMLEFTHSLVFMGHYTTVVIWDIFLPANEAYGVPSRDESLVWQLSCFKCLVLGETNFNPPDYVVARERAPW